MTGRQKLALLIFAIIGFSIVAIIVVLVVGIVLAPGFLDDILRAGNF